MLVPPGLAPRRSSGPGHRPGSRRPRRSGRLRPGAACLDVGGRQAPGVAPGGLRALDDGLRRRGRYLIVRRGEPAQVWSDPRREVGADAAFAHADVSPYARVRDVWVAGALPLRLIQNLTVHPPDAVAKPDGTAYTRCPAFRKPWSSLPQPGVDDLLAAPTRFPTPPGTRVDLSRRSSRLRRPCPSCLLERHEPSSPLTACRSRDSIESSCRSIDGSSTTSASTGWMASRHGAGRDPKERGNAFAALGASRIGRPIGAAELVKASL